ncbi:MAG: hypothetical protein QM742_07980 [Aquabacterium sp.]
MRREPHLLRVLLPCLMSLACGAAGAAVALQEQPWSIQAWGQPAAQVKGEMSTDCAPAGAKAGYRFARARTGGGDAEAMVPSVLVPGVAYELTVPIRAESPASGLGVDVYFRKDAPFYETTSIRTVQLTGQWQTVTLKGVYDAAKPGSVRIGLRQNTGAICLGRPALKVIDPSAVAADDGLHAVSRHFFGIHLNKLGVHQGWPGFEPDVVRMWATATMWSEMQPSPGSIDWRRNIHANRLDYFVDHTARHRRDARILMTLAMTPEWASSARSDGGACERSPFGRRTCLAPAGLDAWRDYVRQVAERFKGRIRLWEIWNEADVPTHWVGGAATMVEMVRVAGEEIRRVDPSSKVIGPNVTILGLRFLNDFLALGGGRHVDGLSIHIYMGGSPQNMFTRTRNVMELMRSHGLDLPIWNTEANTACGAGIDGDVMLQQNLCSVKALPAIAQGVIGTAALGVENLSYYTWEGAEQELGGVGLVERNFRTPTEAGVLYERLADLLRGASLKFMPPLQQGLMRVQFVKGEQRCVIAWSDGRALTVTSAALQQPTSVKTLEGRKVEARDADGWPVSEMPILACRS